MRVDDFDFDLPEERIALRPAVPRTQAKLLEVPANNSQDFGNYCIEDLPNRLRSGDLLVVNDSKVLPACLKGTRPARAYGGGGQVSITVNLHKQEADNAWWAFVRPAKRLRCGDIIAFTDELTSTVSQKKADGQCLLAFNVTGAGLVQAIENAGEMPLPPYIGSKRANDDKDLCDYQTMFAKDAGSVAAPTAGLHFTPELLLALNERDIDVAKITLHVGAGTFLPVKVKDTYDHQMHAEWRQISSRTASAINRARKDGRRVIAVGTTALRSLESAVNSNGQLQAGAGETDIFITPGYQFKLVDGLLTNFHLPKSTLFMLVSAFSGLNRMKGAYEHAISEKYRFYSYGDACLLWR